MKLIDTKKSRRETAGFYFEVVPPGHDSYRENQGTHYGEKRLSNFKEISG